jgi:hypothetical protein
VRILARQSYRRLRNLPISLQHLSLSSSPSTPPPLYLSPSLEHPARSFTERYTHAETRRDKTRAACSLTSTASHKQTKASPPLDHDHIMTYLHHVTPPAPHLFFHASSQGQLTLSGLAKVGMEVWIVFYPGTVLRQAVSRNPAVPTRHSCWEGGRPRAGGRKPKELQQGSWKQQTQGRIAPT